MGVYILYIDKLTLYHYKCIITMYNDLKPVQNKKLLSYARPDTRTVYSEKPCKIKRYMKSRMLVSYWDVSYQIAPYNSCPRRNPLTYLNFDQRRACWIMLLSTKKYCF